ncbi:MAG: hypothetical protein F9K44_09290 [Hyphomicrobiaceae bacterium]|nr:MAG: hypothetical protein F9K44_09290 [Hyphomicrobiaceae bacterium]
MPDYGSILRFLAENPPVLANERRVHASLLELLALSLRKDQAGEMKALNPPTETAGSHLLAAHFAAALARH